MKELIIANVVLALGYVFYVTYLSKYGSINWNRYFLLCWIPASLLIAVFPIDFATSIFAQEFNYAYSLPALNVNSDNLIVDDNISWLVLVYGLICCLFVGRVLYQLFSVFTLIKRSTYAEVNGKEYLISSKVDMPFSFFGYVVVPSNTEESEVPIIVEHEFAHVRANHSFDLVLIQLIQSICWFNPVVWIYEKSIRINHEYEADRAVLKANFNEARYKELLVAKALASHVNIGHAMASKSQLHKRFLKMTSSKKNSIWHYGILIPLIAIVLLGKACVKEGTVDLKPELQESVEAKSSSNETIKDLVGLDSKPEFPGGQLEFYKYLGNEIEYPSKAKSEEVEGVVFVKFIVSETGKIKDVEVLKSPNEEFSKEAVRVVSAMPNWKPATKEGKEVRVQLTIPIRFALDD